jgi:DNA-binding NarL/FixJ family response regulator
MNDREDSTRASALQKCRPRVALADDHPAVLVAFERLLQASCDVVASVPSGIGAIEAVARLQPDVLVVDLMMPGMNGLEVCRAVRETSPGTAVVIVTAFDDEQVRKTALRDGAADFLPKSLASDRLEPIIQRVFAERLRSRLSGS